jgi:hypothetical protein
MKTIVLLLAGLVLGGCNGGGDQEPAAAVEDEAGVFDPMTDQVDKAKAVEEQLMEQKEAVDEALQQAEESAADPGDDPEAPVE